MANATSSSVKRRKNLFGKMPASTTENGPSKRTNHTVEALASVIMGISTSNTGIMEMKLLALITSPSTLMEYSELGRVTLRMEKIRSDLLSTNQVAQVGSFDLRIRIKLFKSELKSCCSSSNAFLN